MLARNASIKDGFGDPDGGGLLPQIQSTPSI
jgi:hypothetical protein